MTYDRNILEQVPFEVVLDNVTLYVVRTLWTS